MQRVKCGVVLGQILGEGETDPNEWVKKLSRLLVRSNILLLATTAKSLNQMPCVGATPPQICASEFVRQLPYISTGRIDLRETDTETAFRIINFLDEEKGTTFGRKCGQSAHHLGGSA